MAFGKIAIHHPNGELEEFELTKPTSSVGRQPGNDIVLPTSAVSRYHAQFDVTEGQVYLVDLGTVNGTFVNDRQVEPNGRIKMSDGDEIIIGDMQLRFIAPEARSGSKRAVLNLDTEAVAVEGAGLPFRLLLDEPQQSVAPGARLQMTLIIENLADYEYPVSIELRGLDPEWAKSNRREAMLEPGLQTQAMISVRPPRSSSTQPGLYPLTIRVAVKEDPSKVLEAVREIDIVGYAGLGVAMRHARSSDGFHLAVQNQGNTPLNLQLEGYQREDLLRFRFHPAQFVLPPGETQQVSLAIKPASGRPFGSGKAIPFAAIAKSRDGAGFQAPVMDKYVLRPTWPNWLIGAGVPILVGAVFVFALVALLLYGLTMGEDDPTATPESTENAIKVTAGPTPTLLPTQAGEIGEFTAEPTEVVYQTTDTVTLRWNASNADEVELSGSDGLPIRLSAGNISSGSYEVPISQLSLGENSFTLTIRGSDGQVRSRSTVISVNAALCMVVEEARPFSAPNPESPPGPPLESSQAIIIGRSPDSQWVRIAYNNLSSLTIRGWLPYTQLSCSPATPPIEEFVVIEALDSQTESVTQTPAPSPTP